MYRAHFHLNDRPFRCSPNLDAYYAATGHERALAQLLQGLRDNEGLLLLCGEPGLGKTLICQRLIEKLADEFSIVYLTNGRVGTTLGLLQSILFDLNIPYEGKAEQELKLLLTDYLFKQFAAGKATLLVIDEAQHLDAELLEELRLLNNLESKLGKVVQILLSAQPAILETLRQPASSAFVQRLGIRVTLEPLAREESADYVKHQIRIAGGGSLFDDEALEMIAARTSGVPRLLNQVAHDALTLAFQSQAGQVDVEAALEALNVHGLGEGALGERTKVAEELPVERKVKKRRTA